MLTDQAQMFWLKTDYPWVVFPQQTLEDTERFSKPSYTTLMISLQLMSSNPTKTDERRETRAINRCFSSKHEIQPVNMTEHAQQILQVS